MRPKILSSDLIGLLQLFYFIPYFVPVVFIIFLWMSCSSCQQVSEFLWLTSFRHNNCSSFRACGIQTGSLPFLLCSSINLMGHYRWSWWCRSFNVPPRLHPSTLLLFFFPQYSAQYHTSILSQCIHLFLLCLFSVYINCSSTQWWLSIKHACQWVQLSYLVILYLRNIIFY